MIEYIFSPDSRNGGTLDEESPYFDLGPKKVTKAGIYNYMCTRNNNFSNRSQKGKIIVKAGGAGSKDEAALEKAEPEEKSADEKASGEKSTTEITAENDWYVFNRPTNLALDTAICVKQTANSRKRMKIKMNV